MAAAACAENRGHLNQLLAEKQELRRQDLFRVVSKIAIKTLMRRDKLTSKAARIAATKVGRTGTLDSFVQFVGGSVFGWEEEEEETEKEQLADGHGDDDWHAPFSKALSPADFQGDDDLPSEAGSQPHSDLDPLPSSFVLEPTPDRELVEPLLGYETTEMLSQVASTATVDRPEARTSLTRHRSSSTVGHSQPSLPLHSTFPNSHTHPRGSESNPTVTTSELGYECSSRFVPGQTEAPPLGHSALDNRIPSRLGSHKAGGPEALGSERDEKSVTHPPKKRKPDDDDMGSFHCENGRSPKK